MEETKTIVMRIVVAASSSLILLCLVVQSAASSAAYPLNILSFNVQNFGTTKYSKQNVIDVLIDIVERYDLILIMELVDVSQTVLPAFIQQLNSHVENNSIQFNYTISERLGRSNNKEQYVFVYRTDAVEVLDTFQYPDEEDYFERPPFSVLIHSIKPGSGSIPPFFIIASHTKPTDAVHELNNLTKVFDEAQTAFSTDLGLIMGDLNADCSYVSNAKYLNLHLVIDTNFTWWIDKLADTTTSASNCAYDRIISRISLDPFVVNNSVEIFLFDSFFNLSSDLTLAVSDHYPVEIALQGPSSSSSVAMTTLTPSSTISTSGHAISSFTATTTMGTTSTTTPTTSRTQEINQAMPTSSMNSSSSTGGSAAGTLPSIISMLLPLLLLSLVLVSPLEYWF